VIDNSAIFNSAATMNDIAAVAAVALFFASVCIAANLCKFFPSEDSDDLERDNDQTTRIRHEAGL
jgi:hypothetical protein